MKNTVIIIIIILLIFAAINLSKEKQQPKPEPQKKKFKVSTTGLEKVDQVDLKPVDTFKQFQQGATLLFTRTM